MLATLVLALAMAFGSKIMTSMLHEICIKHKGSYDDGELLSRIIWIAILLVLFGMSGLGWIIGPTRHMITAFSPIKRPASASTEPNEASEYSPRRMSLPSDVWGELDIPDRITWSVAAGQVVLLVMEIVNVKAQMTGHKRVGGLAAMFVLQVFFECGRSVFLLLILLFDKDFVEAMTSLTLVWRNVVGKWQAAGSEGLIYERGDSEESDSMSQSSSSSD